MKTNSAWTCGIPQAAEGITFNAPGIRMVSVFPDVQTGTPVSNWTHLARKQREKVLQPFCGQLTTDQFATTGLELTREIWIERAGAAVALRIRLRNTGEDALRLQSVSPLQCVGPDALQLDDRGPGDWEVQAQARLKNGVPTSVRTGCYDADYAQAASGIGEQGDAADADGRALGVDMDPFGLFRARSNDNATTLLIGFLSQGGHLAGLRLKTNSARDELVSLCATCEFDGCLLPPGGERSSQWVVLLAGESPNKLVAEFADWVGQYHGVPKPKMPPPSVLCSWYYYGPTFTEADFQRDMAYLEQDRIPMDVVLIDDCWSVEWGDWEANAKWPSGMKAAAARIREQGYQPGIWTCPFLAKVGSLISEERPEWLLRLDSGDLHTFKMDGVNYVFDPTFPGVCDHIEEMYRRLTHDWGFTYHKLDFLRSVFMDRRVVFHDPTVTRLEAYRRGLEAVRRGIGPDAYLSVCGGHFGASLGLADSQRSGSDVVACWDSPPALPKLKQNILRTWMNRLWHTDGDAMMVRRRTEPINDTNRGRLSLGLFTDEEARTITVNQYVGGGITCFTERFCELDADRKALYRHVVPSIGAPAVPVDIFAPNCPSLLLTRVTPTCASLEPWRTLTVCNWCDDAQERSFRLSRDVLGGRQVERYLVFEFFDQRFLGLYAPGDEVELGEMPPHASRVLRIAAWDGEKPILGGTDLHLSGGGAEIAEWRTGTDWVEGRVETKWGGAVSVTVAFPANDGCRIVKTIVPPGNRAFHVTRDDR